MNLTLKDKFKFLRDKFGDTTKGGVGAHINAMIDRYKLFYKDEVGDDNDYCDDDDDDGVIVFKRQLTYSVRMHIDVQIKYNHVTILNSLNSSVPLLKDIDLEFLALHQQHNII